MRTARARIILFVLLGLLVLSAIILLIVVSQNQNDPCKLDPCSPSCKDKPCPPEPQPVSTPEFTQRIVLNGQLLSNNAVLVDFELPLGSKPVDQKAWIGIWKGKRIGANEDNLKTSSIDVSGNEGTVYLKVPNIEATDYTIGYFTGNKDKPFRPLSVLSLGANLPLMTPGQPSPGTISMISTGLQYLIGEISMPSDVIPGAEKTFVYLGEQGMSDRLSWKSDSVKMKNMDFYKAIANGKVKEVPDTDVVSIGDERFLVKNYATRKDSWYTLVFGMKDGTGKKVIVATCTFQALHDAN